MGSARKSCPRALSSSVGNVPTDNDQNGFPKDGNKLTVRSPVSPTLRSNRNLNLNTRLNVNRSNLLHNLTRRMQINQPLVNPHLITIPRLGPLTIGRLARRDFEDFGREANGALDFEILLFGTSDQVRADYGGFSNGIRWGVLGGLPFSTFLTWREVRVIRIRWTLAAASVCLGSLSEGPLATAMSASLLIVVYTVAHLEARR